MNPSLTGDDLRDAMMSTAAEEQHEKNRNDTMLVGVNNKPTPVVYGQSIQLQHVRSGKFIVALEQAAEHAKDCLRLKLCSPQASSVFTHFAVRPRYKMRSDGGRVFFNDKVRLRMTRSRRLLLQ